MKSYSHLWEEYLTEDNYRLAVRNAVRHKGGKKRKYKRMLYLKNHADELMPEMMDYAEHFTGDSHKPKIIYDGIRRKERVIYVPTLREQVVHHMMINVLKPIFTKPMYAHSYGSIPGRGATSGRNRATKGGKEAVERFIRTHPKECKYCLKMDIRKYFDSVPHDRLKAKLRKIIRDERFMRILEELIDTPGGEKGIPIGFIQASGSPIST